jgi:hypothetical protein
LAARKKVRMWLFWVRGSIPLFRHDWGYLQQVKINYSLQSLLLVEMESRRQEEGGGGAK